MRRRLFNILAAAVLLPAFQSCIHDGLVEAEDGVSVGSGYRMVEVVLDDPMSDDTKSVFGGDDSAVCERVGERLQDRHRNQEVQPGE